MHRFFVYFQFETETVSSASCHLYDKLCTHICVCVCVCVGEAELSQNEGTDDFTVLLYYNFAHKNIKYHDNLNYEMHFLTEIEVSFMDGLYGLCIINAFSHGT